MNDDGVHRFQAGDVAGAIASLEAACRVADQQQRTTTLVNLAGVLDASGDRARAADVLTEALAVAGPDALAVVHGSRADVLFQLGRLEEARQDVERGFATARPHEKVVLHHVRAGLLLAEGRLAEAEAEALTSAELAAEHAPHLAGHAYANLAAIAEAAGEPAKAAHYRRLLDPPEDVRPVGSRWHRCVTLNSRGAALVTAGDTAGALAAFEAAYRETLGSDEVEALVCRAGVAGNLAGVTDPLRWTTEAITLGRTVLDRVGDRYGTADVLVDALVARAQHLRHAARADDALTDLAAAEALAGAQPPVLAVRASVLADVGRFGEASDVASAALDLAYASAPHLAAFVHATLADIADGTGDRAGSAEHLGLARDLAQATGDVAMRATAVLSLARLAYLESANDRAVALYAEAEELLRAAGDRRRLLVCLHGRAAVEVVLGRPREALEMLDRVAAEGGATPVERIAVCQVRGSALEASGQYAAADEQYGEAVGLAVRAGLWHVALGGAWWRADALVRWASTVDGAARRELSGRALDWALPGALAAEAVRQRFAHGPVRERWVALAAAPATRSAFTAIAAVGDVELAAAYVDHIAATVSLSPAEEAPAGRGELVLLPLPPATGEEHLPYAASFLAGAGQDPAFPATGFALPPRVRLDPAVPSALDRWIDVAEHRYGFPVRSEQVVSSW
ncbi:tetratricopeptide repeat protein [Actinosynnema sp. NPDC023587]|uniref:tetratricopeptide repeat protein n=1 Tax=Actinosynnema sp. NPDC023587 TaxID=3154695 RepID=UPI00340B4E14